MNTRTHLAKKTLHFLLTSLWLAGILLSLIPLRDGIAASPRAGVVIQVNTTKDDLKNDGFCTLREAVIAANKDAPSGSKPNECAAGSGPDVIHLPAGVYTLTRTDNGKEDSSATGDLDILNSVAIEAQAPYVVIRGAPGFTDRLVHVLSGNVVMRGVMLREGNVSGDGGAVYNQSTLFLDRVTLTQNKAIQNGGAILNAATGSLTIKNSTLSANFANLSGGAMTNLGTVGLNNVTIANNVADNNQDGLGDGGGLRNSAGVATLANTLLAGNQDLSPVQRHADCSGVLASKGHNLVQSVNGCSLQGNSTGNLTGLAPQLAALQDNGGYTPTHALLAGSPAIDAGNPAAPGSSNTACEATDQRGSLRPIGLACDIGAYESGLPNAPILLRAEPQESTTSVFGRLTSAPATTFTITFFTGATCDPNTYTALGGAYTVTTDATGNASFNIALTTSLPLESILVAQATGPNGQPSSFSRCMRVGVGNDSWPSAFRLTPSGAGVLFASFEDYIDLPGQSRWFKLQVQPNSKLVVSLTNLPANYDLTVYKDIAQAFASVQSSQDLIQLGAEFAPDAFSPDAFSPDAFSPDAFSPDAFSPDAFSPDAFSPDAFSPYAFSPDAFSPYAFSPDAFSPDAFSPDAFSPDAFSPDAFSPDAFSPDAFSPDAFSSAQTRSLVAISAFEGLVGEGVLVNTWDNSGDYYIRVRGRNGVYNPQAPFHLEVQLVNGVCANVSAELPANSTQVHANGYKTLVLGDINRTPGSDDEKSSLAQLLSTFLARPEVAGVFIDVGQDARVMAANAQADQYSECPYAKNLVAESIKSIIDAYWQQNPGLEYIVLLGNDDTLPFFRHPDRAMLANEKNYAPPVRDQTASQASLKLGYVLSQDVYGASTQVSLKDETIPVPKLAVGRLVETATEITGMLSAYLSTPAGVMPTPSSALVTGYDFLEDAAWQVAGELQAGLGGATVDTLISPRELSPEDPAAWTADQLRAYLLTQRHDLVFLAGHFSANAALAADYSTRMLSTELVDSQVDLTNALIFSAGCHSGYNIVDAHGVPLVTREPDWAQAFARKQATLIAGTGYQYGDTDFIKYSEKLYLEFSRQLRSGAGPVAIGQALVAAKLAYLTTTPDLQGIDTKSLLEATLFGLPMLSVDMPGERYQPTANQSVVSGLQTYNANPGAALGLAYADVNLAPGLSLNTVQLDNIQNAGEVVTASYYSGPDGIVANPSEPVLPLAIYNVSVPNTVLRGVGFRGGSYQDLADILPLTNAATTEIRGVHAPFLVNYFFPVQPWKVNYFEALANPGQGSTHLLLTPAQFKAYGQATSTGILRGFQSLDFRLFYSNYIASSISGNVTSQPALAAAPSIVQVSSSVNTGLVNFSIWVAGNPAAGIQSVWVTYTDASNPTQGAWQSIDLSQSPFDSTRWVGQLPLNGQDPNNLRFIVQAVNGVGLVSLDSNHGIYYIPGAPAGPGQSTELAFAPVPPASSLPISGAYSTQVTLSALLTSNGSPLPNQTVNFSLGAQSRQVVTDASGRAVTTLSLFGLPGGTQARASFAGSGQYQPSYATSSFTITPQATQLSIDPQAPTGYSDEASLATITLSDVLGRRLGEETLFLVITNGNQTLATTEITDYAGRVKLGKLALPPGNYSLQVYFSGSIPLPGGSLALVDDRYLPSSLTTSLTLFSHAPTAIDDQYTLNEDSTLTVPAPGVLTNDSDPDGDQLQASLVTAPLYGSLTLDSDGSFVYNPQAEFTGQDLFTYQATDGISASSTATVTLNVTPVNDPPVCSGATADITSIWPPDNSFILVNILNVLDPEGDLVTVTVNNVFQDERVGNSPDAILLGNNLQVRAERDGNGDGRVYHIYFTALDAQGGLCTGEVLLGVVPHDQNSNLPPIDGGPLFDSTIPD